MLTDDRRPPLLLVCEVIIGIGHLARTLIVARALAKDFHVEVLIIGTDLNRIPDEPGIVFHRFERTDATMAGYTHLSQAMLTVATALNPYAVLVEYFPFGRHGAVPYLLPFLAEVRKLGMQTLCMLRDIQQCNRPAQDRFDELVVRFANKYFDRILIHADPSVTQLQETFSTTASLTIPMEYTNFVSEHSGQNSTPTPRSGIVLVSAGGGIGGENFLRCIVEVARLGLLPQFSLRIFGGILLPEDLWLDLQCDCAAAATSAQLFRWTPDLYQELRNAEVSVSRCGYNTAQDLIASRSRALVIPYVTPENQEQAHRAHRLTELGLLRTAPDGLTPQQLAAQIIATARFDPVETTLRLDGAAQTSRILSRLLSETARH